MEAVLLTSIGPGKNEQVEKCVKSWLDKHDVYSINKKEEITGLRKRYGCEFIPAPWTGENLFKGKTMVSVGALINFGKFLQRDIIIINSDILLTEAIEFKEEDGIGIGSRYDYKNDMRSARMIDFGFDYVYLPFKFLQFFWGMEYYYLGEPWWDYILPRRCIKAGVPVYALTKKIAFHKKHEIQYDAYERRYFEGIVMDREEGLWTFRQYGAQGLNKSVLDEIHKKSIKL
jgi:hypothetical protein